MKRRDVKVRRKTEGDRLDEGFARFQKTETGGHRSVVGVLQGSAKDVLGFWGGHTHTRE